MKYRYTDIQNHQDPQKPFRRPYLIVRLVNGGRHKDVISLVDSGADVCLFHSDIGRMLGVEIEAGPQLLFQGVSGVREVAYLHRIELIVRELDAMTLEVGFTNSMTAGTGLLGQRGFFEQFDIRFELSRKLFDVVPSTSEPNRGKRGDS